MTLPPIANIRREQSASFFSAKLYDPKFRNARGMGTHHPPPHTHTHVRVMKTGVQGRGFKGRSKAQVTSRSGQMSKTPFSQFGSLGRLDCLQRAQTHPRRCYMSRKCTAWVPRSYLRRSRSDHKGLPTNNLSHKYAVQHMFSGSFCT